MHESMPGLNFDESELNFGDFDEPEFGEYIGFVEPEFGDFVWCASAIKRPIRYRRTVNEQYCDYLANESIRKHKYNHKIHLRLITRESMTQENMTQDTQDTRLMKKIKDHDIHTEYIKSQEHKKLIKIQYMLDNFSSQLIKNNKSKK